MLSLPPKNYFISTIINNYFNLLFAVSLTLHWIYMTGVTKTATVQLCSPLAHVRREGDMRQLFGIWGWGHLLHFHRTRWVLLPRYPTVGQQPQARHPEELPRAGQFQWVAVGVKYLPSIDNQRYTTVRRMLTKMMLQLHISFMVVLLGKKAS